MKVGVLGAGQLARMMALAGVPMGHHFSFYDSAKECCAEHVGKLYRGEFDDSEKLAEFADSVDVITYEFENVPLKTIDLLPKDKKVFPPRSALEYTQDRLNEKQLFRDLGIATPEFKAVSNLDELKATATELGLPFVLKTRQGGYDGKGQCVIKSESDLTEAEKLLSVPCIAEAWVPYQREVSMICVYAQDGSRVQYDINENEHRNGILHKTENKLNDPMFSQASKYVDLLAQKLGYVGTLTVEFFECDGKLLANEYAPRVHNSGHWTIDGSPCSQFENHIRAILNLPLGDCSSIGASTMFNLIGTVPNDESMLAIPGLHLHDYQKTPRDGRKVGHINVQRENPSTLAESCTAFLKKWDKA